MSNYAGKPALPYPDPMTAWRQKTDAEILTERQFKEIKTQSELYVVGVMGFAGRWERSGLRGRELAQFISDCRFMLTQELTRLQERHAQHLIVSSGATNEGVLQAVYDICARSSIQAMGITSHRALNYPVGQMKYVMPFGHRFGDESALFVRASDAFLLLGGGEQSRQETFLAQAVHKPITVIQGFGGAADEFTAHDLPGARFVQRTSG